MQPMGPLSAINKVQSIQTIMNQRNAESKAGIRQSSDMRPKMQQRLSIALDTAATAQNPIVINNPFNGYFIESATDNSTSIQISMGSVDQYNTDNYVNLLNNASAKMDEPVKQAVLTWPAQTGKVIVIVFFLGIDFRPGSIISVLSGGVSIAEGVLNSSKISSTGAAATVACPAGSATMICPSDSGRKLLSFYTDSEGWVGDSAVAPNARGIPVTVGIFNIRSTSAHYFYPSAGAANVYGNYYG